MYTYNVTAPKVVTTNFDAIGVWIVIAFILSVIGGVVTYVLFLSPKNEKKFKGFVKWLYDFLTFKKLTLEALLKVTYVIFAIFLTLVSFGFIGTDALAFFSTLILGNLILRIAYEGALLLILMYKNTNEIKDKIK